MRQELSARNRALALARKLAHVESYGELPVVVYEPADEGARHGNFLDASYAAILKRPEWRRRLDKVHAQARRCLPRSARPWRELDSCTSSDALLMNAFCHPATLRRGSRVAGLLGVMVGESPVFGFRARVPLANGATDRTEVDMRLGGLLVEAKLTESDFQSKQISVLRGYRDFEAAFDPRRLPRSGELVLSYQLIRNVLAAHAGGLGFCVLLDERRPDLLESWYSIMQAVRVAELRPRCMVLTWQELSAALPAVVGKFLEVKYGIVAAGRIRHF